MVANSDTTARPAASPDRGWAAAVAFFERPDVRLAAFVMVWLIGAFDLLWRLGRADWHFDEILYARDGWNAIHLRDPVADHPLVGKYLIGLSQIVFGRNVVGVRVLAVLCSLAGTWFAFALARRFAGWWAGIAAAALWAGLPRGLEVAGEVTGVARADRYGILDTIWLPFSLAGLFAGWWWTERASMRRAVVVGVVLGLAVGVKFTALTVVLSVLALGVARIRPFTRALSQAAIAGVVAVATFAITYLPYGTAGPGMVRSMLKVQREHVQLGHVTPVGGTVWFKEPWYTNIYYWVHGQGLVIAVALLVAAGGAWWSRDRDPVAYLWFATLVPVFFLCGSPVALAHYWLAWFPPLVVLAGIGTVALLTSGGPRRILGAVLAGVFALSMLLTSAHVATMPSGDYRKMAAYVRANGPEPKGAIVLGTDLRAYFPDVTSIYGLYVGPRFKPDLVVIEKQFALQTQADVLTSLRRRAKANHLTPMVIGDVEFWYRKR